MGAVGVFPLGVIGQDHHRPDILSIHDRTQSGPTGLFGPKDAPGPVDFLGGIEIMAVDAAVGSAGGAEAGGQEDDILFSIPPTHELIDNRFFQAENLVPFRRWFQCYPVLKPVDDDHQGFFRLAGDFQDVEPGVFEISPEMAAEIGDAGDMGQGRQGEGHALAGPGEMGDSSQRPGR